jgi:type I restriction enzyme S subunit
MISEYGLNNSSARWIKEKSVLIALAGQGKTRGTVAINHIPLTTNQSIAAIMPDDSIDSDFLFQNLESRYNEIRLLSSADGLRGGLNKQMLSELLIPCTSSIEQQKIGAYFKELDNLITLHQREYDKTLNIKKAMLEKMFPKNGEDRPEIRFAGFTDAWEQRKLGEIASISMNRRIFKEQTTETGDIPFFKIGTFGGKPDAYISRDLFEEYKAKYPYPKVGDILISASGSIGRTVEYSGKDEYFQDSNIVWLNHEDRIDNSFLKFFYAVVKWMGIEGSTIKRLYNDNILNTKICLPSIKEQQQIGIFFTYLDNLITLHQRELKKLQNMKKALLEKMFVQG